MLLLLMLLYLSMQIRLAFAFCVKVINEKRKNNILESKEATENHMKEFFDAVKIAKELFFNHLLQIGVAQ